MDPEGLIQVAPAIAKVVTPVAAAIPFTGIVKRMLGPAADEVAEMWRDQVRLYRYERQLKCVEKAEAMAKKAGFTPQAVPPKILFPLLEGASFEEDEDIHTMWAALLANAASEKVSDTVRPGFIAILRDMAPDEAALLRAVSEQDKEIKLLLQDAKSRRASAKSRRTSDASMNSAARVARKRSLAGQFREGFRPLANETRDQTLARYTTCLQVLRNNGLIHGGRLPHLDGLGSTFLSACRPPQPGK